MARSISEIAREIRATWTNVNFAAKPYLGAMFSLDKITDNYDHDSAPRVISYFLSNAKAWRGPEARRIKAELNEMLRSGR